MIALFIYFVLNAFVAGVMSVNYQNDINPKLSHLIAMIILCLCVGSIVFLYGMVKGNIIMIAYRFETIFRKNKIKKHDEKIKELLK